jgi:ornithine decarboxylase
MLRTQADDAIQHVIASDPENIDPFFVVDIPNLKAKHGLWTSALPRVEPFFAIKCNPNPTVLRTMISLGIGFDCASKGEIATMLSLGVSPNKIIYANPCKPVSHIKYAASVGVHLMTFDNADELVKCKASNPSCRMVLRVLTDDSTAVCRLGLKFGTPPHLTIDLLRRAVELDVDVVGVSFHCGSGATTAAPFHDAVRRARQVFDEAASLGMKLTLLDIGGGYPGHRAGRAFFEEIAAALNQSLDEHFPPSSGVQLIAEPGRFFVHSACTLATNVIARRVQYVPDSKLPEAYMYYLNDGVYSSFNCTLYDHYEPTVRLLKPAPSDAQQFPTTMWGPTCDSMDCISRTQQLPEVQVGDWLVWDDMGAYTMAAASTFNGFEPTRIYFHHGDGVLYKATDAQGELAPWPKEN